MSRFFIDRPIFAWVIAIVIMLVGGLAIRLLPIAQYPEIAPPSVSIIATYPGASADTLENTVTQPIEQQMNGIDHLEYLSSVSESSGQVTITLTFAQGTNPDIAQVQVQNKLQLATPILPEEVQQQGVVVAKASRSPLLVLALYSVNGAHNNADLSDLLASKLQDPLSRVNGVGNTQVFGAPYAMRIWLDPFKLSTYALNTGDIVTAVSAQNTQVAAGQIGAPPTAQGQVLNAIINAQSRLQTPQQFRDIILKTDADGAVVHLSDVARVEMGQDNYNYDSLYNGHPASGFMIQLAPGANALDTVSGVKARVAELAQTLPPDVRVAYPFDTSPFVRLSIEDVVKTLMEAIVLVFLVMFVFLQNWRATLIPTIAVPVVLLGTFGVLAAFHYSINTLTMFGMVLAIGLLVDDAIVVVENVERLMREEGLSPRDAARKSMDEITGALIGIVLVLSAVFLPMAFFGGSTGVIYRQFAVTIVSAMGLSVLVALILTPALCATLLKPTSHDHARQRGFFGWFNRTFDRGMHDYQGALRGILRRLVPSSIVYVVIVAIMALLFVRLPTGFLPDEDQGIVITLLQLPPGATLQQTMKIAGQIEHHFLVDEKADVSGVFCIGGFSNAGQGLNAGQCFTSLKDWKDRAGAADRAQSVAGRAMASFFKMKDATAFSVIPPAVLELGNATGFDFELEDRGGVGQSVLTKASNQLLGMAAKDPLLAATRPNGLPDIPQLKVDIDQPHATALGVSLADVDATLGTALGSSYIDDFVDRGRVKRVYAQADAPFRGTPDDLNHLYVRGGSGTMAPFSAFMTSHWIYGPSQLQRYNGLPSSEILGQPAAHVSSGAAMAEIEKLASKLPNGLGYEWTGESYEERQSGGAAPALYALSVVVVFLALAALYESWSVPTAVILVLPLGLVGALLAVTLRGLTNDVYFQVGLLTTMGLAAKNAILIIEFAEAAYRSGKPAIESAMEGARLRLRPILMTSLTFIAGVAPLALSHGPGSGSQNDIGTGVIGGMLSATALAIFFVPAFYVTVRKAFKGKPGRPPEADAPDVAASEQVV